MEFPFWRRCEEVVLDLGVVVFVVLIGGPGVVYVGGGGDMDMHFREGGIGGGSSST